MNPDVWLVIAIAAIGVAVWVVWSSGRRAESQISAARQEMQNSLATQSQNVATQLNNLAQSVTQQLGQVRQELQANVASTGKMATDAQQGVSKQLQSAMDAVQKISLQLGAVQQAGDDLKKVSTDMQQVLGGAKTRGMLGEIGLERILQDSLPQGTYEIQYRFSTGDIVDAIVRSGERILPIDSKFPLESYRRLVEAGDESRKEFAQAVRKHADAIAAKYILQAERTLDIAFMFVPSETIYYELLMTEDARNGRLDAYCRNKSVIPVSPNTLYAYIGVIVMGLRGMQIEENARRLASNLSGLKKQFDSFAEIFNRLGTQLHNAQQNYENADSKLTRAQASLDQMAQGALPEAAPKALETSSRE
jgi:DNA recombination protein RmuC